MQANRLGIVEEEEVVVEMERAKATKKQARACDLDWPRCLYLYTPTLVIKPINPTGMPGS